MVACHHGVTVLYGGHRADGMGAAQVLFRGFRDAPMQDFSFAYQVCHYPRHLFRLHVRVDAVLVIKVYVVGLQAAQRTFHRTAYHVGREQGMTA